MAIREDQWRELFRKKSEFAEGKKQKNRKVPDFLEPMYEHVLPRYWEVRPAARRAITPRHSMYILVYCLFVLRFYFLISEFNRGHTFPRHMKSKIKQVETASATNCS